MLGKNKQSPRKRRLFVVPHGIEPSNSQNSEPTKYTRNNPLFLLVTVIKVRNSVYVSSDKFKLIHHWLGICYEVIVYCTDKITLWQKSNIEFVAQR